MTLLFVTNPLRAHTSGENYVFFDVYEDRLVGTFEINTDDLEKKFGIKSEKKEDWLAVVQENAEVVQAYIPEHFKISGAGESYPLEFKEVGLRDLGFMRFAKYDFVMKAENPIPNVITIENTMLQETGRLHRGLVGIMNNYHTGMKHGDESAHMIFGSSTSVQELDLTNIPSMLGARAMVPQGVLHIWIGIDHILFLLCLLLPTVLIRKDDKVIPVEKFHSVLWRVFKIVTLFTIAHSITLALAALDFISISSRLVESIIALSIIIVGVNNIFFKVGSWTSIMIVILGLFHGLGFASVMGELPFRMQDALKVVLGFNIGVELGQMVIVAAIFPLLFFLRKHPSYQPVILQGGSAVLTLVAGFWFVQRAFGLG
ncbi:HupE/UreJ family protein [Puniceicoccales bacterium CK1056]|uniref:HupE/UreJ family protein n=1 Tax=Oceanipulchritudo coccoides TaxID=2706888 RepID=A0A6B2M0E8_9BACT|nr:HupE/UreJ family protein [Oceanipulchritudo coccoides]NDV61644.1 HupE/UreJ family protein [Oceanipulchritudo coccoides]